MIEKFENDKYETIKDAEMIVVLEFFCRIIMRQNDKNNVGIDEIV